MFSFDFVNPDDPNAKPYGLATMVIHYPTGYTVDTTVPPQCHGTDAELLVEGPSACPAASKLGGGEALSDIGGSDPGSRYTKATTSDFNNQDEITFAARTGYMWVKSSSTPSR